MLSSCPHYQDEFARGRAVKIPNEGALEGRKRLQTESMVGDKEQDPCTHFTIFTPLETAKDKQNSIKNTNIFSVLSKALRIQELKCSFLSLIHPVAPVLDRGHAKTNMSLHSYLHDY